MLNEEYLTLLDMLDAETKSEKRKINKAVCGAVILAVTALAVILAMVYLGR